MCEDREIWRQARGRYFAPVPCCLELAVEGLLRGKLFSHFVLACKYLEPYIMWILLNPLICYFPAFSYVHCDYCSLSVFIYCWVLPANIRAHRHFMEIWFSWVLCNVSCTIAWGPLNVRIIFLQLSFLSNIKLWVWISRVTAALSSSKIG